MIISARSLCHAIRAVEERAQANPDPADLRTLAELVVALADSSELPNVDEINILRQRVMESESATAVRNALAALRPVLTAVRATHLR